MPIIDGMIQELNHEIATTRKLLERIPDEKFDWKPHEKSWNMGDLSSHIVNLLSWVEVTLTADEFDIPENYTPWKAETRDELVAELDETLKKAHAAMKGFSDARLMETWTLKGGGQTFFSMPRLAVMRTFVLNHLVHHRGQLSVYLRLNDIPVPSIYGPSADES